MNDLSSFSGDSVIQAKYKVGHKSNLQEWMKHSTAFMTDEERALDATKSNRSNFAKSA